MIDPHKQHRLGTHAMFCPTWTPHDEHRKREAARARALELIGVLRRLWARRLGEHQTELNWQVTHNGKSLEAIVLQCLARHAFRQCGRWANEERRVRAWRV